MTLGAKAVIVFWLAAVGWSTWHRKDGQTLSEGSVWLLRHRWLRLPTAAVIALTILHIVSMVRSNREEMS